MPTINNRSSHVSFLNVVISLCVGFYGPTLVWADEHSPPNIVLFIADDMGVMDTSLPFLVDENNIPKIHPLNTFYRTPSMHRLAEQGVRFSQCFTPTAFARPLVSP